MRFEYEEMIRNDHLNQLFLILLFLVILPFFCNFCCCCFDGFLYMIIIMDD